MEEEVDDLDDKDAAMMATKTIHQQMTLTLGRLKTRVQTQTGGAVCMNAELEDPHCYFGAQVRLCSSTQTREATFATVFQLKNHEMELSELFCSFLPGSSGTAMLASFKVDTRMAVGPRVIRSASATKLLGEFLVDMGKFVVFEDIGGDVLRGVILSSTGSSTIASGQKQGVCFNVHTLFTHLS